ncbi:unnamed protein product [Blepharisma stoltei]|uniref:L-type lectin-like domain-containing protein n=1 Tax=Blepharisma stoltei TaxID=1481888 RepID=A0AAU9IWF6_9CILI|nr:unnamed protein product [Blepharisma stoltei]
MILRFFLLFFFADAELDSHSFKSPLIPEHAHKFDSIGSAVPLKKYVRLAPPLQHKVGALISKTTLEDSLVVIEIEMFISGASIVEDIGATFWFSQHNPELFATGIIYGVTEDFKGIAVVINPGKQEIMGYQYNENPPLNLTFVSNLPSCTTQMKGEFHMEIESIPNKLTVYTWQKGKPKTKCIDFATSLMSKPYIGISANTGENSFAVFDISSIRSEIPIQEGNQFEALKMMQENFKTELSVVKNETIELTQRIQNISESQELIDIQNKIGDMKLMAKNLKQRIEKVRDAIMVLHVDDTFAIDSNEYITKVGAKAAGILDKVKSLQDYVSGQGILKPIQNTVDEQASNTLGTGKQLEEAANRSHEKTKLVNQKIQNEYRFVWIFSGLVGLVIVLGLSMCKLVSVEKIHTL